MTTNRRVVYFHPYPHQIAGAQVVTVHLATTLKAAGWDAQIIVPGDGPFVAYARDCDVDVRVIPGGRSLLIFGRRRNVLLAARRIVATPIYWVRLWQYFRRTRAVVHVNDHRGVMLAGVPARLAKRAVVWHSHGPLPSRALNRACARVATRVVAVSTHTLKSLSLSRRTTLAKASVIHNCLIRRDTHSKRQPERSGGPLIAVGARLHPDKGIDVLLEATAILRGKFPELTVAVAGHVQPGYEAYARGLQARCTELGIHNAVHFLGRVEDTDSLWAAADVYVQPSRAEPFGLCLLEAMAAGTPVVASAIGGMREVVEHTVSGLLCKPEDPASLAGAIQRLLDDPSLAENCIRGGGLALDTKFSPARLEQQFDALYRDILGDPSWRIVRVGTAVTLWTVQRNQLLALQRSGLDIVCLTDDDEWSTRLGQLGILTIPAPLSRRPTPFAVFRWTALVLLLLSIRRRVVIHSHNVPHTLGVRLLSLALPRHRVVETFHNSYELLQPGRGRALVRGALRATRSRCHKALFISQSYEEVAQRYGLAPCGRTEVIGTGIDVASFKRAVQSARQRTVVRADLGVTDDDQLSIVVARLDPQKGHRRYLDAAALLRHRFPDLRHILVGHGLGAKDIREHVRQLRLGDRVHILGYRDDVAELISASDLLVLPSSHEGFGRCVVEGLAAGVPVVATDCDGPRRILDGGRFGMLVGMEPEDLAAGMAGVLENAPRRKEWQDLGPIRAQAFDEITIASRVKAIYEELGRVL